MIFSDIPLICGARMSFILGVLLGVIFRCLSALGISILCFTGDGIGVLSVSLWVKVGIGLQVCFVPIAALYFPLHCSQICLILAGVVVLWFERCSI